MKIIFDHSKGQFTSDGSSLLEVYAIKENETTEYMFDNGWLPFREKWYQTRSSRLELAPISSRRKKELSRLTVSDTGNLSSIVERAIVYNKFDKNYLKEYLSIMNYMFFFDDCFCGIVNFFDDVPFYTFMIWDEAKKNHSYGTLSFYYLIDKFYNLGHKYLYISEYYPQFAYKIKLQGFQWWDGNSWNKTNE